MYFIPVDPIYRSSVGPDHAKKRGIIFLMVTLILAVVLTILIVFTKPYISKHPGIYAAPISKSPIGNICLK